MDSNLPNRKLYGNRVLIVGTSHLLENIDDQMKEVLNTHSPHRILVELDPIRLQIIRDLISSNKSYNDHRELSNTHKPLDAPSEENQEDRESEEYLNQDIIETIAKSQDKATELTQLEIGKEFFTVVEYANAHEIDIIPIDIGLKDISNGFKSINGDELAKFLDEMNKMNSQEGQQDFLQEFDELSKNINNPEFLDSIIGKLKEDMPNIYRVLIEDRNIIMANNILEILAESSEEERILAVVGAGHLAGISKIIAQKEQ